MTCKTCGSQLQDGARFCDICGAEQEAAAPVAYNYNYQTPVNRSANDAELSSMATRLLVFGILAVALPTIPGLIFGILATKTAKEYAAMGGLLSGKAMVGKILGMIGMIYNIVACAIVALYLTIICGMYGCIFCGAMGEM